MQLIAVMMNQTVTILGDQSLIPNLTLALRLVNQYRYKDWLGISNPVYTWIPLGKELRLMSISQVIANQCTMQWYWSVLWPSRSLQYWCWCIVLAAWIWFFIWHSSHGAVHVMIEKLCHFSPRTISILSKIEQFCFIQRSPWEFSWRMWNDNIPS